MITPLSDFLSDMRDSDKKVLVKESKLRAYAQQAQEAILIADKLKDERDRAIAEIERLKTTISVLNAVQTIEEIDLFA